MEGPGLAGLEVRLSSSPARHDCVRSAAGAKSIWTCRSQLRCGVGSSDCDQSGAAAAVALPGSSAVSYLEVPATDSVQSSNFYRQVFGWVVSGDGEQGSFTGGSGHVIGHWRTDLEVAGDRGVRPYIYVSNLDQILNEVAAHGGTVVQRRYTEGDLWVARFRDPAGNVIGVWQQIPSSAEPDD